MCGRIAHNKGKHFWLWFYYASLLFPVCLIHVLIMDPDEDGVMYNKKEFKCPKCGSSLGKSGGMHVFDGQVKCPACLSLCDPTNCHIPDPPKEILLKIALCVVVAVIITKFII